MQQIPNWLSILHMAYKFAYFSLRTTHPLLPPQPPAQVRKSVLYVYISIVAIYVLVYDICFSLSELLYFV